MLKSSKLDQTYKLNSVAATVTAAAMIEKIFISPLLVLAETGFGTIAGMGPGTGAGTGFGTVFGAEPMKNVPVLEGSLRQTLFRNDSILFIKLKLSFQSSKTGLHLSITAPPSIALQSTDKSPIVLSV
jgi:hypothetical protein